MNIRHGMTAWIVAASLMGTVGQLHAQAPAPAQPNRIFTKRSAFILPVKIDERERSKLREVRLYVKSSASETWTCKESVPPTQSELTFRAPQDGEYWFSVVTVDLAGNQNPSDVSREAPELIVVVDTKSPEPVVRPVMGNSGEMFLQCDVRDANPDPSRTRMEFLAPDMSWQPLPVNPSLPGTYRATEPVMVKGVVRATVTDRAGNLATKEISLAGMTTVPVSDAAAVPAVLETRSDKVASTPNVVQALATTPARSVAASMVHMINERHVSLAYQIESTNSNSLGRVEVWVTRDEGRNWQRVCEDQDRRSPVEFDLPGEGVFGVSVVVTNNLADPSVPPTKGENPDWWIEVDCSKPVAQLLAVRPCPGKEEQGCYLITWTASDKNLKSEPIDLYFATRREGPWTPIARGLRNDGNYRWTLPPGLSSDFIVRLEVSDQAGNVAQCDLLQRLLVEKPRARVLNIMPMRQGQTQN